MVKKRARRCGGDEVACDVGAVRSHWITDILGKVDRLAQEKRWGWGLNKPNGAVEAARAESEALPNVLKK